jgi:dolichol kinase
MSAFVDARDSGAFYVTHFTLLLGLAIPIWLSLSVNKTTNDTSTFPESLAGILSTGIGDAAASIIGSSFGRVRIAGDSRKTLEGTVAGATAMLMSSWGMAQLWPKSPRSYNVWQLVVSTLLSALLEASTDQFDNIFVSLHFFSLLCALH